jgi:CBS domain containing-hemolysin-like protein
VDEYGGASGIITMEDILEEIVGDINDEFDEVEVFYSKLDDSNYVFDGKTPITDLTRIIYISDDYFDYFRSDIESIGGLIVEIAGRIPRIGEVYSYSNLEFKIESADRKRVRRVKITIHNREEAEE